MLSVTAGEDLSTRLAEVERESGRQFVVALFLSLDGENLEDYTNRLFRHWQIGSKARNDGVLFALYKHDRRWRVEVGYGLESLLTDLEAAELAQAGVPYFKKEDFDGGITVVVNGIADRLAGKTKRSLYSRSAPKSQPGRPSPWTKLFDLCVILFVLMSLPFLTWSSFWGDSDWNSRDSGWSSGESSSGSSDGGGFSGGGGSSGGGGASGSW